MIEVGPILVQSYANAVRHIFPQWRI